MYGTTVQYILAVEASWKQFLDRNVFNVNEAVKLIYNLSTQIVAREAAFMVLERHFTGHAPDIGGMYQVNNAFAEKANNGKMASSGQCTQTTDAAYTEHQRETSCGSLPG